jgi:formate dehydrogenase subunit gamma
VSFFIFVKDNAWRAYDGEWLSSFGGLGSGKDVPSGRFNAGETVWFWGGVVLLGIVVGTSGVIQLFPNWNTTREVMGEANLVHAIFASLFIAAAFGHIYLGTIGMEGAYQAMSEGHVDETWAREHHELWYNEIKQGKGSGKVAGGTPQPATGDD